MLSRLARAGDKSGLPGKAIVQNLFDSFTFSDGPRPVVEEKMPTDLNKKHLFCRGDRWSLGLKASKPYIL
jgi:hypothetical protein